MYYLFSDHLGSTSEVRKSDGTLHSKQMYKAFGEARYQSGTLSTGHRYTGQLEIEFGLVHFGPRAYDPSISTNIADGVGIGCGAVGSALGPWGTIAGYTFGFVTTNNIIMNGLDMVNDDIFDRLDKE